MNNTCITQSNNRYLFPSKQRGNSRSLSRRPSVCILNELNFPRDLIHIIWQMTSNRTFVTWNGETMSSIIFNIVEGLMQGTVNSPSLFNIYTHKVPSLFNANRNNNNIYSAAFADDYIIMVADKHPAIIQTRLEDLVNKISRFYLEWNLKINPTKCETILFHRPLNAIGNNIRHEIKNFSITIDINNTKHKIEHKKEVRYLGVILDHLLRLKQEKPLKSMQDYSLIKRYHTEVKLFVIYFSLDPL